VCSAVRIAVAAGSRERRLELRRAAVTAEWEVVAEADDVEGAYSETIERRARFLVLDASAAGERPDPVIRRLKSMAPTTFVIAVGDAGAVTAADATLGAGELDGLRDLIRTLLHGSGDHSHANRGRDGDG
jgi:DNA-binding NarL/FixJ family response regulator